MTDEIPVPRRAASAPLDPAYRPDCLRLGLRIDGEERSDVTFYDADGLVYRTNKTGKELQEATSIEPYWRFPEQRQQRRARERWEAKRK